MILVAFLDNKRYVLNYIDHELYQLQTLYIILKRVRVIVVEMRVCFSLQKKRRLCELATAEL